jgi:D-alanyl-D-alanine carboxypeptidase/D-alanyl-D-alanine-endopeptidase (penicillin-binding protein 4)
VLLQGRQRGTTWHGDVLVSGSGDPGVSDALSGGAALNAFAPVREALAARGITRIAGRVRAIGDAFPGPTTGFGWAYDDFDAAYSAAVDELLFNEGVLVLTARAATRVGRAVTVTSAPTRSYPRLLVQATTRDSVAPVAGRARPPRLEAVYDSIGDRVVVTGTLALGDSASITLSYRHPSDAYTAALTQSLEDGGIRVTGRAVAKADTLGRAADTVVVLQSAPLSDVLRRMQKPSQNQIAELLFRTSGLRASGDGSADSARAVGAPDGAMSPKRAKTAAEASGAAEPGEAESSAKAHLAAAREAESRDDVAGAVAAYEAAVRCVVACAATASLRDDAR